MRRTRDVVGRFTDLVGQGAGGAAQALVECPAAVVDDLAQAFLVILQAHLEHAGAGGHRGADRGCMFAERGFQRVAGFTDRSGNGLGAVVEGRADPLMGADQAIVDRGDAGIYRLRDAVRVLTKGGRQRIGRRFQAVLQRGVGLGNPAIDIINAEFQRVRDPGRIVFQRAGNGA